METPPEYQREKMEFEIGGKKYYAYLDAYIKADEFAKERRDEVESKLFKL